MNADRTYPLGPVIMLGAVLTSALVLALGIVWLSAVVVFA